jgi:hypothetical protein
MHQHGSIMKKARYVTTKLAEADQQLAQFGTGMVHMAMDAEFQCASFDLRRERNIEAIAKFRSKGALLAIYLHYLVPRTSESHSWMIDETVDRFGPAGADMPTPRIFTNSKDVQNGLPAWKQDVLR